MCAIETDNKRLKNVLPKNFGTPDLDKTVLGEVMDLFTNLDIDETEHNKDILGWTYEYCLAQFAEKEGKGGGEFYTTSSIVNTIVSILKPFDNCRVYERKTTRLIKYSKQYMKESAWYKDILKTDLEEVLFFFYLKLFLSFVLVILYAQPLNVWF